MFSNHEDSDDHSYRNQEPFLLDDLNPREVSLTVDNNKSRQLGGNHRYGNKQGSLKVKTIVSRNHEAVSATVSRQQQDKSYSQAPDTQGADVSVYSGNVIQYNAQLANNRVVSSLNSSADQISESHTRPASASLSQKVGPSKKANSKYLRQMIKQQKQSADHTKSMNDIQVLSQHNVIHDGFSPVKSKHQMSMDNLTPFSASNRTNFNNPYQTVHQSKPGGLPSSHNNTPQGIHNQSGFITTYAKSNHANSSNSFLLNGSGGSTGNFGHNQQVYGLQDDSILMSSMRDGQSHRPMSLQQQNSYSGGGVIFPSHRRSTGGQFATSRPQTELRNQGSYFTDGMLQQLQERLTSVEDKYKTQETKLIILENLVFKRMPEFERKLALLQADFVKFEEGGHGDEVLRLQTTPRHEETLKMPLNMHIKSSNIQQHKQSRGDDEDSSATPMPEEYLVADFKLNIEKLDSQQNDPKVNNLVPAVQSHHVKHNSVGKKQGSRILNESESETLINMNFSELSRRGPSLLEDDFQKAGAKPEADLQDFIRGVITAGGSPGEDSPHQQFETAQSIGNATDRLSNLVRQMDDNSKDNLPSTYTIKSYKSEILSGSGLVDGQSYEEVVQKSPIMETDKMIEEMILNQNDDKLLEQLDDLRFGSFAQNLNRVKRQSVNDFNKVQHLVVSNSKLNPSDRLSSMGDNSIARSPAFDHNGFYSDRKNQKQTNMLSSILESHTIHPKSTAFKNEQTQNNGGAAGSMSFRDPLPSQNQTFTNPYLLSSQNNNKH